MSLVFGFDIGTTSIGWAAIQRGLDDGAGRIVGLGVRIFPEARDPKGVPLNQTRRSKRLVRRQTRRRKERRRGLNLALAEAGLLPPFGAAAWPTSMADDPWQLRKLALCEPLTAWQVGRAIYHLGMQRHFAGRELAELDAPSELNAEGSDERAASENRQAFLEDLERSGKTLGAYLAERPDTERKRGVHAVRSVVQDEFDAICHAQAPHHTKLQDPRLVWHLRALMFHQRPVFWRRSTLGSCRLIPGAELCPRGSWLSQQRRMLEKLNNLEFATGNRRPLDTEERAAILARLQGQASMSWGMARKTLASLYAARGEKGLENRLVFNLEQGGEKALLGNPLEARLAGIFGEAWEKHPHKQAIRDAIQQRLWSADYAEVGKQRVVILPESAGKERRAAAAEQLASEFGLTAEQAEQIGELRLPTGWEPFSTQALAALLPRLEDGVRFGALLVSPDHEVWRDATFPNRDMPTGEVLDRLPSPSRRRRNGQENHAGTEEQRRLAGLRNPTVIRTQNELRKVVNNLLVAYGKPDLIRIELAREVGLSQREREEMQAGQRAAERARTTARKDLQAKGIPEPSRPDIEKWVLWKECQGQCPYTGDIIGFNALFGDGSYEVEHIWPRSISLDDSQRNKTLCRKDVNIVKGARTPFQFFQGQPEEWAAVKRRLEAMIAAKGKSGFPRGKVKRFVAETIPDDFTARQLVDTSYAARLAAAGLKRLWPDMGAEAPVRVQAVSGRVTAQLRKLWGLNNVLASDGEKTRADHRHHAIDALVVACADPGMTNRLSRYWQQRDSRVVQAPELLPPWAGIRNDAETAIAGVVVSHRVRRKVSGPLHEETIRGDTGQDLQDGKKLFRLVVARKAVEALTKSVLASDEAIVDRTVRNVLRAWVAERGGDPKKAFATYPTVSPGGPPIKRVRIQERRQLKLMAKVANGYADTGENHHVCIRRDGAGRTVGEIVSLHTAARRLAQRQPVVDRSPVKGAFVMTLGRGDTIHIPSGERAGYWTVQGVWADGPIVITRTTDADGSSVFRPNAASLVAMRAVKVSVDPIGRVRPAGD